MSAVPVVDAYRPLADRMRPRSLAEFVGQAHLVGEGRALSRLVAARVPQSMILWGPPGTGKTTLARLLAQAIDARFVALSAVLAGVKEIRAVVADAQAERSVSGHPTVLFLDEVHRFSKSQQDTFLPYVEDGTLVFIGATTENPSFEVNAALLSRARVYVLKPLTSDDLGSLVRTALADRERGLGTAGASIADDALALLVAAADGDARRALGLLETAVELADGRPPVITSATLADLVAGGGRRFDKRGEQHYDQISALHKAVRGSDPDAALYWLCRMLDGGCDPGFLARRLTRMAVEDLGLADPRALAITMDAWHAYERMGSPEGDLALAYAAVYLAVAPKSNAVYGAFNAAMADVKSHGSLEVPMHLRNAPTKLMKELGYGSGYRYAHDEPDAYSAGQQYLPDELADRRYYAPVPRGLEIRIAEAMARRREGGR